MYAKIFEYLLHHNLRNVFFAYILIKYQKYTPQNNFSIVCLDPRKVNRHCISLSRNL